MCERIELRLDFELTNYMPTTRLIAYDWIHFYGVTFQPDLVLFDVLHLTSTGGRTHLL